MPDPIDMSAHRRRRGVMMMTMEMPERPTPPDGPFTITISDKNGKMFEVEFPDYRGNLPEGASLLGTAGCERLTVNLLTGALRAFEGLI